MSKYICTGSGEACPFSRPCSLYTPMETEVLELPTLESCVFDATKPVTFRKIMRGGE